MSELSANGLKKSYPMGAGRVEVLWDVDFLLSRGEAVAVTGPSGAGKSTMLNLLGSLDRPDAGTIGYGGQPLEYTHEAVTYWRRQVVGFVFQYHFLLPDFSALENLLLPVRLLHEPTDTDRQRAEELLAALELDNRAEHRPGELSGGEQQRVAVARAFMNNPYVVLADEPFGNLDRQKSENLSDLLFALSERHNTGLVIVTHDPALAERADRVLALREGRLHSNG